MRRLTELEPELIVGKLFIQWERGNGCVAVVLYLGVWLKRGSGCVAAVLSQCVWSIQSDSIYPINLLRRKIFSGP